MQTDGIISIYTHSFLFVDVFIWIRDGMERYYKTSSPPVLRIESYGVQLLLIELSIQAFSVLLVSKLYVVVHQRTFSNTSHDLIERRFIISII